MDRIANFIIKLKNGNAAGRKVAEFPYSRMIEAVANVLKSEGFLADVSVKVKKKSKKLEMSFDYEKDGKVPKISGVKRISHLSQRTYIKAKDMRKVRNGFGKLIVSTPEGVMTGDAAKKAGVGGEALFEVW